MTFIILGIVFIIALSFVLGLHTYDKIDTEIEIEGTTDEVWKIITNFQGYSSWNPFITNVSGSLTEGSNVDVTFVLPFSRSMKMQLQVQDIDNGKGFSWVSKVLEPKIFDSVHYFRVEKTDKGSVKFIQGEKFSGLLLYVIVPLIKGSLGKNFDKMNQALKNRVEGVVEIETSSQMPTSGA